tara:strand:+ start:6330 stop:7319 length:990 start_codon:yes stop_codon:yes gene_type:complete
MITKILCFYPNGEDDTMANVISDGLNNTKDIEVFKYDYASQNYTEEEVLSLSKKVDYIFIFWCKYQYNHVSKRFTFELLDKINRSNIVVYIDGSEYNINGRPTDNQTLENLKNSPLLCKGEPWIDEEMYKRCNWYFKRETYKEDLLRKKIVPLLVSSKSNYFHSENINLQEKKYDIFCSFGHTWTGLRAETQDICQKLLNEGYNNIIGSNFPYKQYIDYIINSYIGISAWGAGNSCRRMWEIMSNKTCCFVQKKQIEFPNIFKDGVSYVEYSTPKEFEEKIRYYLNNKEKCTEIGQKGYEHIKKYHTSTKRIEYIFKVIKGNDWKSALK